MELATLETPIVEGELDPLRLLGRTKQFRLAKTMELEVSKKSMQMSGYLSTEDADLVNDIIRPEAFKKHIGHYRDNAVYCYNHDYDKQLGFVEEVEVDSRGLYLRNITLVDIPMVRDIIWPLVQAGALKQQSIGFLSLDGKWVGDYYYHTEVYTLEGSLVTVACNPSAVLDNIKTIPGFENYKNMNQLMRAHQKGVFKLPSEISKSFAVADNPLANKLVATPQEETAPKMPKPNDPDFRDLKATAPDAARKAAIDTDGEPMTMPVRYQKGYHEVGALVYAAVRGEGEDATYLFPIGVPTSKGYRYDWSLLATSVSKLLGARGGAEYDAAAKSAILDRIAEGYDALGKPLPEYKGVAIDTLTPSALSDAKFAEIDFKAEEKGIFETKQLLDAINGATNILTSHKGTGKSHTKEIKDAVRKWCYAYFDVSVSVHSAEDVALINRLMAALVPEEDGESPVSAYDVYLAAPDGVVKTDETVPQVESAPAFDKVAFLADLAKIGGRTPR